jgi:hypothetical protein
MLDMNDYGEDLRALMEWCAIIMDTLSDLTADVSAIRDGIRQHSVCYHK